MGSGKSSIADCIRKWCGENKTFKLDLDITGGEFDRDLEKSLSSKYVIGEMSYGGRHTTQPEWVRKFKDKEATIVSVVLLTRLDTCIERTNSRGLW
jgi:hypothetical protein